MRAPLKPRRHNYKFRLRHLNLKLNLPRRSPNTTTFRRQATTLLNAQLARSGNLTPLYHNLWKIVFKSLWPTMHSVSPKKKNLSLSMSINQSTAHSIVDQTTQSMIAITSAIIFMISTMLEK